MVMCIQNLVKFYPFILKDIEQKLNSDINQGPLLCCKFAKNDELQYQRRALMVVLLPAKMKKIRSKMKELEC